MSNEKETIEPVEPSLEVDEHISLQKKGWIVQRIGWMLILGVMIGGLLGLFGEGVFSNQSRSSGSSTADYERFYRYEAEMKVLVHSADHISTIALPEEYVTKFRVVRFIPEPSNHNTVNNMVRYNFMPSDNHIVSIYLMPKSYGSISGILKINEQDNLHLNHFIYP